MQKTRRELLDDLVQFMGETDDVQARSVGDRILNRAMIGIWLRHPFRDFQSPVPYELTLVTKQIRYALPDYFGRIGPSQYLRNMTRGGTRLSPRQTGQLAEDYPNSGTSFEMAGYPTAYEVAGVCGVHTQPASAGDALEVLSTENDDTDIVVSIGGDDAGGRWTRNQVTLQGTTPVGIGTWAFVDEFSKAYQSDADPVVDLTSSRGIVTLRKVVGGTELQRLFTQESAKEHSILAVFPKPIAADVIAIPVIRRPKRLFHDADVVPALWEPALWEAMTIEWALNTGSLPRERAGSIPRPALVDLIAFDNEITRAGASRTVPYGFP